MHIMTHRLTLFQVLPLAAQVLLVLAEVTWESPAAGDVYMPGDTLQAVWTSSNTVISPSFTICAVDNSTSASDVTDCGTAVWPSIDQNGTEYMISLAVPNITGKGEYYLLMKDDKGIVYDTPNFALALKVDNSTANATATSNSLPTSTSIAYLPSHSAPTDVAIAVPLALVIATLLTALLLLLCRARRSRRREKDKLKELQDAEKLKSKESSTLSFASATDIERAVWALAAARGYGAPGPYAQGPPPHIGMRGPLGGQGQGLSAAAAAAALGFNAFGWAHAPLGQGPPMAPLNPDAYTPAPVRSYGSSASAASQPYATATSSGHDNFAPHPPSQADPRTRPEQYSQRETGRRRVNWQETDWNGTDRMFAEEPTHSSSQASGPPQLPAIQLHMSSPPPQVQHTPPPPVPPKELFPGSLRGNPSRPYSPPYAPAASTAPQPQIAQTPGTNAHASLNVISNYFHASPVPPQGQHLAPPNACVNDMPAPRVPPPSMTRARTLRRLETVPEDEKPLPNRPEDRVGTDFYGAVSKAVRG